MPEKLQRAESMQSFYEVANVLAQEMGEQPRERLDWLMNQDGESFGNALLLVNSVARGLSPETGGFDGDGVQAGVVGGSIPPDQEDKITLLDELVAAAHQRITSQTEQGENPQAIMSELAVAIPTVVNKLHLFADGNGRTSRMLRMVLRDSDQLASEKMEALVHKNGYETYDTTPVSPVEASVLRYMREVNGASEVVVIDDVVSPSTYADEVHQDILRKFPSIGLSVIQAYSDTANFGEVVRLIARNEGVDTVSLSGLLGQIVDIPDEFEKFIAVYRGVRRQRVEVLISGLTGELPVPLRLHDKDREVNKWINGPRKRQGLGLIDSDSLNTIQDFQMAYCETFAPRRDEHFT